MPTVPARKPFNPAVQLAPRLHSAVYTWLAPAPITEPLDAAITHWTATRLIENQTLNDVTLVETFMRSDALLPQAEAEAERVNAATSYLKQYFALDIGGDYLSLDLRSGVPAGVRRVLRQIVIDLRYLTPQGV